MKLNLQFTSSVLPHYVAKLIYIC